MDRPHRLGLTSTLPRLCSAVALASDADNTGSSALAFVGDIVLAAE